MPTKDIFKKNIYSNYKKKSPSKQIAVQLDLFSYLEEDEEDSTYITDDLSTFQVCTIYNSNDLPEYEEEKDLLLYYQRLTRGKETIILPKLKQMDPNIYEAALDLGAKPSMALRKVIIPEIIPGVLSGFILAVTLSLDDYIITAFTRNNSFQTISTYVYGVTAKKGALPPTLRALTTLIFIVTLILLILLNIKGKKKEGKR